MSYRVCAVLLPKADRPEGVFNQIMVKPHITHKKDLVYPNNIIIQRDGLAGISLAIEQPVSHAHQVRAW